MFYQIFVFFCFFLSLLCTADSRASTTNMACVSSDEKKMRLRIVGSSTAFPQVATVAELFGALTPFQPPVVESTGTGGGVHIFCSPGPEAPDMVSTSRVMTVQERRQCRNHQGPLVRRCIGVDGLVFVVVRNSPLSFAITSQELFLSASAFVMHNGQRVVNPYTCWSDIHPRLPAIPIKFLGGSWATGLYDVLRHRAIAPFCHGPMGQKWPQSAIQVRNDGHYQAASEHSNVIIQKTLHDSYAVGCVSYAFFKKNKDILRLITIGDTLPTLKSMKSGHYPLAYRLYVYGKKNRMITSPAMNLFFNMLQWQP